MNKEWKERYLNQSDYDDKQKEIALEIFKIAEKSETFFNKDLCNFILSNNVNEVDYFLRSVNTKIIASLRLTCAYMYEYVNWCISECLTNDPYTNQYEKSLVMPIIERIVDEDE